MKTICLTLTLAEGSSTAELISQRRSPQAVSAGCRAAICFLPSSRPPGGDPQTPLASCPLQWVSSPLAAISGAFSFCMDKPPHPALGRQTLGCPNPFPGSPPPPAPHAVLALPSSGKTSPKKGEHLLDKLSQVLTEGFAARPLALSVAVERVGAGGLFMGRAAGDGKGRSDGQP